MEQTSPARHFGHDFFHSLHRVIRTACRYPNDNLLIRRSIRFFQIMLDEMTADDDVNIFFWNGQFQIGGKKLAYRKDMAAIFEAMSDYFITHGIVSINFLQSSRNAAPEDILTFVRLLNDAVRSKVSSAALDSWLNDVNGFWVQVLRMQDHRRAAYGSDLETRRSIKACSVYLQAIETVRETAIKVSHGITGMRKARRLAQTIVDLIREDMALMIRLAAIGSDEDYLYTHSVNVALLATSLGGHIGLADTSMEQLAICGLFHDLGKADIGPDILLKPETMSEEEWRQMKAHPVAGMRKMLRFNAPQSLRSKILLGPFEHHLNPDMTGYPPTAFMERVSLFGKILRIADAYEAMTSPRAYRPESCTPDEILRKMWRDKDKHFDETVLKCFISMMGLYPIGSIVLLNDGTTGLVLDYPEKSEPEKPLILHLVDDGGGVLKPGQTIYLPDGHPEASGKPLEIIRGILPSRISLAPAVYFHNAQ